MRWTVQLIGLSQISESGTSWTGIGECGYASKFLLMFSSSNWIGRSPAKAEIQVRILPGTLLRKRYALVSSFRKKLVADGWFPTSIIHKKLVVDR